MSAPKPRDLGVNSKATGTMAMPPGVDINGAFYNGPPPGYRGKTHGPPPGGKRTAGIYVH